MTDATQGPRLVVDADLHLSIDGVEATLVGDHNDLTLRTDEPARLSAVLRRGGLPTAVRQLDRLTSVSGVELPTVTIAGPKGRVARIAPATRGVQIRGLPAGTRLQVYRPLDLVPSSWRRALGAALAALVIARVVRWVRHR